jgi:ferredoxin-NADP reductase
MPAARQGESFRVLRVQAETADAVSLILRPEESAGDFAYEAGQYLNLRLEIAGQTLVRCYSLSSAPHESDLRITVKQIRDGRASRYLNAQSLAGERLLGSRPQGAFTLRDRRRAFLGVAAGSGITPVISMLKHVLHSSWQPCRLLYVTPTPEQTIFHAELDLLRRIYPGRLIVHHWHTRLHGPFAGPMAQRLLLELAGDVQPDVYVCGPSAWMEQVQGWVQAQGECFGGCYNESFCADSAASAPTGEGTGATHEVILQFGGASHRVAAAEGQSLLVAARAAGVDLPSGCEQGKCGCCMARCLSGQVDAGSTDFLTLGEIEQGYVLCCQAKARSACTLSLDV